MVADFQAYDCLDVCLALNDENLLLKKFVNVQRYLHEFRQLPELKDFIETSAKK